MRLPDNVYTILKWICMICLPALATAYVGLAAIWGFPYADEVAKTTAVVCTLLGALLGVVLAWLTALLLGAVLPHLSKVYPALFGEDIMDKTIILRWLYNFNPLTLFK